MGNVLQGRYRVVERVGAGGMGTVYRAVQIPFERDVAVKVLGAEHSQNEALVQRFATEALIIAKLRHPNTLKLYDFGRAEDGRLYIVTEFLSGIPLDELLESGPALPPARALKILGQICDSLAEAHVRNIVHRDLKPANIFIEQIGDQEIVKVLDFGVARVAETHSHTLAGTIFGTPAYMSPEQAHGEEVDARSDLYAVGIIAYQCLAGRLPFHGTTPMSVLLKHIKDLPVPLLDLQPPPAVDPRVDGLVLQLLEKDPDARPESALEVRRLIDGILRRLTADPVLDQQLDTLSRPRIQSASSLRLATASDVSLSPPTPSERARAPSPFDSNVQERPSRIVMAAFVASMLAVAGWYVWQGGVGELVMGMSQSAQAADPDSDSDVRVSDPSRKGAGRSGRVDDRAPGGAARAGQGAVARSPDAMGPPELGPEFAGPPKPAGRAR